MSLIRITGRGKIAMNMSTPPLLRGLGTLLVTAAAVVAICIARQAGTSSVAPSTPAPSRAANGGGEDVAALASEVRELRAEVEEQDVVDEVLENRWFDWISITGTATIAASFFAEAYLRRRRNAPNDA